MPPIAAVLGSGTLLPKRTSPGSEAPGIKLSSGVKL
jgi:hypothetical protein